MASGAGGRGRLDRAAALSAASTDSAAVRLLMDDSRRRIARLDSTARAGERVPTSEYAIAYAELGDTLATLDWLDSMLVRNDSYRHQIRVDPLFDFLRHDLRYRAWEARCGLPPLAPAAVTRSTQPAAGRISPGPAVAATSSGA